MRIRSIKPEFYRSSDISSLDWEARFLFIALWSYVDDNGVGVDKLSAIAADLFADDLETDSRDTFARVSRGLQTLSDAGRITRYRVGTKGFLHITNWGKHQRIDKPNRPRYPAPTRDDAEIHDTVATPSRHPRESPATGTEEQRNRGTEKTHGASDDAPSRFEEFWQAYPSRGPNSNPKKPAQTKYDRIVKTVDPQTLIDAATRYALTRKGENPQHTAQAQTWLNQERWNDETNVHPLHPSLPAADVWVDNRMSGWACDHADIPDDIFADRDKRLAHINELREARRQELLNEYTAIHGDAS